MPLLDDFKEDNENEDRIEGDEAYQEKVWEGGLDNPALDDDDEVEAGTIEKEQTVKDVEKEIKGEPVEDEV